MRESSLGDAQSAMTGHDSGCDSHLLICLRKLTSLVGETTLVVMHSAAPTQPAPDSIPPLARLLAAEPARRSAALRLRAEAALLAHPWVLRLLERQIPRRPGRPLGAPWALADAPLARPGEVVVCDATGCPLGHDDTAFEHGTWRCLEPRCPGEAVLCGECRELAEELVSTRDGDMCALCAEMACACSDGFAFEHDHAAGGAW